MMAAFLAVLLLFSGSLPLVQHVCAMAAHTQEHEQPCKTHAAEEAPSPHGHAQMMHDREAMAHVQAQQQSPRECSHEAWPQALPDDCCTVETTQGIRTNAVSVSLRLSESLTATTPLGGFPAQSPRHTVSSLSFDTGPPVTTPLSLHILHASFLI
ncbi:MAG: hypothetical protein ACE5G0_12510 [Rhodothermales bacterium]